MKRAIRLDSTLFPSVPRYCEIGEVSQSDPGRSRRKAEAQREANPKMGGIQKSVASSQ
jgi:hypothetical protein